MMMRGVGVLQQESDHMECVLQVEKELDRLALTSPHHGASSISQQRLTYLSFAACTA